MNAEAAPLKTNDEIQIKEITETSLLWWWLHLLLNPRGRVRLHNVGGTNWICCWFVHHILSLPVVYLWTLTEPATLTSVFFWGVFQRVSLHSLPHPHPHPHHSLSSTPSLAAKESTSPFPSACSLIPSLMFRCLSLPLLHPSPHSNHHSAANHVVVI